ncbi:MAG: bifunctional hydroxymethylpyrimidine kinase/phosphomethylpyrimidine kinase [Deltaproteobacteria bacterium]|nr:bifunctional hydroxymethylpyrimidine kinase/phosphomethylpyrimidine kinase [Deltaproteobacteria bacterium]
MVKALTIATSDSGGGAGLQADLKTFAALGVFGLSVVTAVSAQNSYEVTGLECLSPGLVREQLRAVFSDMGAGAIKIGLIGNAANARVVGEFLRQMSPRPPVIVDPVMVSTSGHVFLEKESIEALMELNPWVSLLTPNIPEAEFLSGLKIKTAEHMEKAGQVIRDKWGLKRVLVKGGHQEGEYSSDLLVEPQGLVWFKSLRVKSQNNHGSGCTLSSAIAAGLAQGLDLGPAIEAAKEFVASAMADSVQVGRGPGPLNHFYKFYSFG